MALTADVKEELASVEVGKTTVRAAELAALLRFSGGLHIISGRIAVESELDYPKDRAPRAQGSRRAVRRAQRDIRHLGQQPRRTSTYLVRVIDGGETLARQTGLLDARRRPVRGLPNRLTTGSREELAAVWRGAFWRTAH